MNAVKVSSALMAFRAPHRRGVLMPDPQPEELDPALAVQARGLRKTYGAVTAVKGLDLSIRKGEVIGLLGPNGSGKTTTILMLMGLTEPTGGWVRVLGYDPLRDPLSVKRRVGYMPDSVGFYDHLTARQNLEYTAMLAGFDYETRKARIAEVLERLQLSSVADRKVGTFSRGMKQRLGLAEVLMKKPGLIILDEPTSGLDPEAAREFLEIIRSLKEQDSTIMLSSHLLHQVQAICDRVMLFNKGEKVLEGTVEEITRQVMGGGDTAMQSANALPGHSSSPPTLDEVYARYFEQLRNDSNGGAGQGGGAGKPGSSPREAADSNSAGEVKP